MFPFHVVCPEPGLREIRCVHVLVAGTALPVGEYGFLELYCEDLGCDCRRVLIQVTSRDAPSEPMATINYGWESSEFYTEWMHGDEEAGRDITSASLDPLNPQSEYADEFLDYFQNAMITNPEYVARLARHYEQFKQALREQKTGLTRSTRPGRNEPCSCGSGKKYKKCCGVG